MLNFLVAFMKLGYGLITHSLGMQADGFHSFFDGISNIIGLAGIKLASEPPDAQHPYGHQKFESMAAGGIGLLLVGTCLYLLAKSYYSLGSDVTPHITKLSFGIMIITMIINIGVALWEKRKGQELNSPILIADSYHTASDVLVSLSVIAGLSAVSIGYTWVDSVVAVFIAGIIAWTAITVFREVFRVLADAIQLNPEDLMACVLTIPGTRHAHSVRTRGLSHHIFVDLSIHVDPQLSVEKAHEIADAVEDTLKVNFLGVEDVVVHIEPEGH